MNNDSYSGVIEVFSFVNYSKLSFTDNLESKTKIFEMKFVISVLSKPTSIWKQIVKMILSTLFRIKNLVLLNSSSFFTLYIYSKQLLALTRGSS